MRLTARRALELGFFLAVASPASVLRARASADARPGTAVILGTVTDTSLQPVDAAEISIVLSSVHVSANAAGRFQIVNVPDGNYLLVVRRVGFRPTSTGVEVHAGDTLRLAFLLEPVARDLATVLVTDNNPSGRMRDFLERRAMGVGEFFTQQQIDARNAGMVLDIIRQAKGVRIATESGKSVAMNAREWLRCPMQVFVDGIPLAGVGFRADAPFDLQQLPSPKEIAGIEIYSGPATIPLSLNLPNGPASGKRTCGMVLLWTRDGSG
jgi:hypothetical protein